MQQTEILNFLQVRTTSRMSSRKLAIALKKRKYERKSARLSDRDYPVYIYMVRELNDFDRNNMSNEIKTKLLQESAVDYGVGKDGVPF
jgi:hypothetical protein